MNDFENEPGIGGGYDRVVVRPLVSDDGIERRIVMRFRGRPVERVSVVLEEDRDGVRGSLMRYDDAHGVFHRHYPGWPEPSGRFDLPLFVEPRFRAIFADHEIRARYTAWEAEVFGQEGGDPT